MNRCRRPPLTAVVLGALLGACATAALPANRDPGFEGRLRRIAIVVYCPQQPADEAQLRDGLASQLQARGLETISGSKLDGAFKRRIDKFGPDALLVVMAEARKSGPPRLDISVYPHGQARKRVWQATVAPGADGAPALAQLPQAVAEQLAADRLL